MLCCMEPHNERTQLEKCLERTLVPAANWKDAFSPYSTSGLQGFIQHNAGGRQVHDFSASSDDGQAARR